MPPPNEYDEVVECANQTGDLIKRDSTGFTDLVARTLHAKDPRWGRKVRQNGQWESRNADAIAYLMEDGNYSHKHLVDVVISSDSPEAKPAWQVTEGPAEGNGYWMVEPGTPDPPPDDGGDLQKQIDALVADVAQLDREVEGVTLALGQEGEQRREADLALSQQLAAIDQLAQRVTALEALWAQMMNSLRQPVRTSQTAWHSHSVQVMK